MNPGKVVPSGYADVAFGEHVVEQCVAARDQLALLASAARAAAGEGPVSSEISPAVPCTAMRGMSRSPRTGTAPTRSARRPRRAIALAASAALAAHDRVDVLAQRCERRKRLVLVSRAFAPRARVFCCIATRISRTIMSPQCAGSPRSPRSSASRSSAIERPDRRDLREPLEPASEPPSHVGAELRIVSAGSGS